MSIKLTAILLIGFFRATRGQSSTGDCLLRSCAQTVTGRNLPYSRALQIIQNEEYLDEVDLDEIRRKDDDNYQHRYDTFRHVFASRHGCAAGQICSDPPDCHICSDPPMELAEEHADEHDTLADILTPQAAQTAAAAAGVAAAAAMAIPMPPMAVPGSAPLGVPPPGTVLGGLLPVGGSPAVVAGLALVPAGLAAVAIFPPTPIQTVSALSVIFSEAPTVIRARLRRRRSIWRNIMRSIQRRKQEYRQPVYRQNQLAAAFERLKNSRLSRTLKGAFDKLYMRYRCVMPQLVVLGKEYAKRRIPLNIKLKGNDNNYGYGNDVYYPYKHRIMKRRAEIMMHNCLEGMAEPLYGVVTQVMLVEDKECQLNITCTEGGDKIGGDTDQTNLTPNRNYQYHTTSHRFNRNYYHSNYNNVDRQTGEVLATNGPPRCRTRPCQ